MSLDKLRAFYQPHQSQPADWDVVKLTHDANYGYLPTCDVQEAINDLEHKLMLVRLGMHEMSPLEKLGMYLLMDRYDKETK